MSTLVQRAHRFPPRALLGFALLLAFGALFAVAFDQSYLLTGTAHASNVVHEFFHDARHLLGVPCH
ncbi:MAG: CbtB-domain containing protein [Actinomycetota bacterium]